MSTPLPGTNLCVLVGTVIRPPEVRTLPSGSVVAQIELRVERSGAPTETVPISHPAPPVAVTALAAGAPVVVRGRVRRRFFRAGGTTQSRTEVVADQIVPAGRRATVHRLLERALADLAPA